MRCVPVRPTAAPAASRACVPCVPGVASPPRTRARPTRQPYETGGDTKIGIGRPVYTSERPAGRERVTTQACGAKAPGSSRAGANAFQRERQS
jgi:hypothetical protein